MSSPVITRRGAIKAKIQTRAVVKNATQSERGGSGDAKSTQQRSNQSQQSNKSSRQPNLALIEAKKRAKILKMQQEQQLQQELLMVCSASGEGLTSRAAIEQGFSMAVSSLGAVKDIYQNAVNSKEMIRGSTGLIYDESMVAHRCLWDPQPPECPERFSYVLQRCRELKLVDRCIVLDPVRASVEEVLRLHSREHYNLLEKTSQMTNEEELEELSSRYDSIYLHPSTFELSLLSVGCTRSLVENIVRGHLQNGMAIIRPPGHHAMKSEFNGYCFFNNVALAAKYALDTLRLQRILIVDWDVHHGQGTQRFFYEDPRVLYFSIHRFEFGTYWPNLKESNFDAIGQGAGLGYNFNVPLNKTGMGNGDYLAIFQQLLVPVAFEFQPELVIISAGYDAALGCPEGEMEVTPACYPHLINPLLQLANGRVAVILEGGYCLESLAEGAALTLRTLLGDPCPVLVEKVEAPCPLMQEAILNCIYTHRAYWKCLQVQDTYTIEEFNNILPIQSNMHQVSRNFIGGPTESVSDSTTSPMLLASEIDGGVVGYAGGSKSTGQDCKRYPTRGTAPVLCPDFIRRNMLRLEKLKNETLLLTPGIRVCYVYDELMMKHVNLFEKGHPEQPERIRSIYHMHQEYALLTRMQRLSSRRATPEEVKLVHSATHVNLIRKLGHSRQKSTNQVKSSSKGEEEKEGEVEGDLHLHEMGTNYNSVYFHPSTYESATMATGCVLQVVDSVLKGESRSGVCIVRPPGHHAEASEPHGFCIFNNIAIAARYAIERYHLERILIVDWDVHHGNGTQHIFDSTSQVLYMSLHRYDNGSFFPKGKDGNYDMVGKGDGVGYNVNIPWNKKGMGDFEYALAFQHLIMPIAYEYDPQLVLVSAGFDAAIGDPLGGCKVTPEAYGWFTHWLTSLANGRVIVCLEGGYNINSIAYAMTLCTKSLLGDPLPTLQMSLPSTRLTAATYQSCIETLRNCVGVLQPHWKCLTFGKRLPKVMETDNSLSPVRDGDESAHQLAAAVHDMTISSASEEKDDDDDDDERLDRKMANALNSPDLPESVRCEEDDDLPGCSHALSQVKPKTLTEFLKEHEKALQNEEMFAVIPLKDCLHLSYLMPEEVPSIIRTDAPCVECLSTVENWCCLHCFQVLCGRYIQEHMLMHHLQTQHPLALSFSDLSVWCYPCEAYIDNHRLFVYKSLAHRYKFGEELVWSYGDAGQEEHASALLLELKADVKTEKSEVDGGGGVTHSLSKDNAETDECQNSSKLMDLENCSGARRKQLKSQHPQSSDSICVGVSERKEQEEQEKGAFGRYPLDECGEQKTVYNAANHQDQQNTE